MFASNPSPQEEDVERFYEPVSLEDIKKMVSYINNKTNAHRTTQRTWQHAQDLHRSKPHGVPASQGNWAQGPISNPVAISN